ncbi:TetR/AcrR family transcriptional regulator [Candidatus Acetothermia bacterium]|nr:TetR/AcrR family transcriptional regulator [Candidatus Acetothermia bacterium]MBI3643916.1 TetR/AcrR family transcriptional regulator [Candidatus Acetothermia bacterium]
MRDKEATRDKILNAAEHVFAEKGYHGTLVDEIAESSKTSKGAIYFHFPSKEEIFFALMDRFANAVIEDIKQTISKERGALNKIEASLEFVLQSLVKRKRLAKLLLIHGHGLGPVYEKKRLEIYDRFADVIELHLQEAVDDGSIPPLDVEITAHAWLGAISELVIRWLYTGGPEPLERMHPALTALFLRGIGARPSKLN